jgi:hypothetical protein
MILPHLNLSSTQELTTVSAGQCLSLDRLYQASQCVLYQRSLSQARRDPSKLRHRGLCIDAAMALLAHQVTIYSEFTSSGPYCLEKRHIHTLTTHDYFISSMAVALDLYYGFESEPFAPSPSDFSLWGYDRRAKMISALETSNEFCRQSKDESVEDANAYGMFSFVVAKAREAQRMIAKQQQEVDPQVQLDRVLMQTRLLLFLSGGVQRLSMISCRILTGYVILTSYKFVR